MPPAKPFARDVRRAPAVASRALAVAVAAASVTACSRNAAPSPSDTPSSAPSAANAASATTVVVATTLLPIPTYIVAKGDTMNKIAKSLGVPLDLLMAANGMTNANKISIGQKLRLPAIATTTTTP